jgi:SAM-dependent methyltransferase
MDQKKIWDHFQVEGVGAFEGSYPRLRYLLGLLPDREKRVLDVGVGNGTLERLALKRGLDIYSLDPSEGAISLLRRELQMGDRARVGFSQEMPFPDEYFDAVFASEVFEHLDDSVLKQSLEEIERVLKPGGQLIGTVPSRENLGEQTVVCPKCGEMFHRWGHAQSFDRQRLGQILEQALETPRMREKYFVGWQLLNAKGKISAFVKLGLLAVGIHGTGETLVFVAKKPANAQHGRSINRIDPGQLSSPSRAIVN